MTELATINTKKVNLSLLLVMLLVGLVPIFNNGYNHQIMYYFFWAFGLLGIYYLRGALTSKSKISISYPSIFLVSFVVLSGITVFWSVDSNETLGQWFYLIFYAAVFFLIVYRFDSEAIDKTIKLMFIIGTGVALVGVLTFVFLSSSRIFSTFMNQNPLGIYLGMLFLLGLSLYVSDSFKSKIFLGCLITIGNAFIFSGSKGAMLASAPAFIFILLGFSPGHFKSGLRKVVLVLLLLVTSNYLLIVTAPIVQGKMTGQIKDIEALFERSTAVSEGVVVRSDTFMSVTVAGRISFWQTALEMSKDKPLTGVGLGNYHKAYFAYDNDNGWYSKFTHNHYLQTAAETGVFGLTFLLLFFFSSASRVWGKRTKIYEAERGLYYGLIAAAVSFSLHIFIDFSWNMPAVAVNFWVILAMLFVLGRPDVTERGIIVSQKLAIIPLAFLVILISGSLLSFVSERISAKALTHEREGNVVEALDYYSQAQKLNPINHLNYIHLSYNHYLIFQETQKVEELDNSFKYALRALQLSPYDAYSNNWIARVYYSQQDYQKSEEFLVKAINLSEFKMSYYDDLAKFYLSLRQAEKAEKTYLLAISEKEKAMFDVPTMSERERVRDEVINIHLGLTKLYQEKGDLTKAKEQLQEILNLDEKNSIALEALKNIETKEGFNSR